MLQLFVAGKVLEATTNLLTGHGPPRPKPLNMQVGLTEGCNGYPLASPPALIVCWIDFCRETFSHLADGDLIHTDAGKMDELGEVLFGKPG
jgi:hypothetical protein